MKKILLFLLSLFGTEVFAADEPRIFICNRIGYPSKVSEILDLSGVDTELKGIYKGSYSMFIERECTTIDSFFYIVGYRFAESSLVLAAVDGSNPEFKIVDVQSQKMLFVFYSRGFGGHGLNVYVFEAKNNIRLLPQFPLLADDSPIRNEGDVVTRYYGENAINPRVFKETIRVTPNGWELLSQEIVSQ